MKNNKNTTSVHTHPQISASHRRPPPHPPQPPPPPKSEKICRRERE
ncbi:hypothetical protein A2U01_0081850, partial [Trifolium medium]|nr:hypothetical protein [Trifolium medium]